MDHWIKKGLTCMALLAMMTLFPGIRAGAQETATKLFTLQIRDGYQRLRIPVYEYQENGQIRIAPEASQVTARIGAKTATGAIKGKTAYFKANYRSAFVTKKVTIKSGGTKRLKVKVISSSGKSFSFRLKVKSPSVPAVSSLTLSEKTYYVRQGALKAAASVRSQVPVTASVKITTKRGTAVYTHSLGSYQQTDPQIILYWDGRNDAGAYVGEGSYKLTVTLTYANGKKTRSVSSTVSFKVRESEASSVGQETSVSGFDKTWTWKMMVTGNDTLDYLAEAVCQSVLQPGMTEVQRAKMLFFWCAKHFTRNGKNTVSAAKSLPEKIDVSSAAAKQRIKAYASLRDQLISSGKAQINTATTVGFSAGNTITAISKESGDCLNMARMYQVLCRHAGLDCDILQNSLAKTDPLKHFWNVVRVDGAYYECDARMANARGEGFVHCLRGTAFMETLNPAKGNGTDDVRRYSNIYQSAANLALYAKISKTDCPGR